LCTGNQSVIAVVPNLTQLQLQSELCFIDFDNELARGTTPIQRTIVPYWKDAIGLGGVISDTKSKKKAIKVAADSWMKNFLSMRGSHQARWLTKLA
jgi:hypothetical protein